MNENPLYKKAYFQCARRAILENEMLMGKFIVDVVKDKYSDEKLNRLNILLKEMFDNDMLDLIMGQKPPEFFKDMYDIEICQEIAAYAISRREHGNSI